MSKNALYPILSGNITFNTLGVGMTTHDIHSIYQGMKPSTLLCCFVDNKAVSGDLEHNPFRFHNRGLRSFQFYVNGKWE